MGSLSPPNGGSPGGSYPPSYYSGWEGDMEKEKEPVVDLRPIQFLKTRATTFSSLTGKEIKDKFGKTKRFITRSGTGMSELNFEAGIAGRERENDHRRFSGWRGGVLMAVVSAGAVLLINVVFTIWAAIKSKSGMNIGQIWEAECETIQTADLWIHIVVNILGTVLLGSSNYTMQCLSSPTRREVDVAHSTGKFLDIGLPSFRNLTGWVKKTLFGLLVASTVPLHFLWNSAVFTTTQRLDYQVSVVTPSFLKSSEVDCAQNVSLRYQGSDGSDEYTSMSRYLREPLYYVTLPGVNGTNYTDSPTSWYDIDTCSTTKALLANATAGKLERLTNEECINAYGAGNSVMSHRGNLLVVTKNQSSGNLNASILLNFRYEYFVSNYTGNNWICDPTYINEHGGKCDWKKVAKTANENWNLGDIQIPLDPYGSYEWSSDGYPEGERYWEFPSAEQWPIDYCLSQVTDLGGKCKLQYSLIIMICVIVANIVKFGVIFFFLRTSVDPVLATIGDGISSFLERPDPVTVTQPFLTRKVARKFNYFQKFNQQSTPSRYSPPNYALRFWHAPSLPRWTITMSLCILAISIAAYLLTQGNGAVTNPYSMGFGNYNSALTLRIFGWANNGDESADFTSNAILISFVTVANIPQVIVSCLYFAYNTVYTSMVSADEWSRFTTTRKTLRTTDPVGMQRSTYWLSLPWTYALPLAAASSVLHWLISQSLFVARTEVLNTEGEPEPVSYMAVGYSPLAILFSLLFGSAMVLGMIVNGARKLKGGILVGNNSLAIAAACQRPEKDCDAYLKPVMWGALKGEEGKEQHCCFTSMEVEPPKVGGLYI